MGYRPRRSSRKNNTTQCLAAIIVTLAIAIATGGVGSFGGCAQLAQLLPGALTQRFSNAASVSTLGDIPAYSGSATVYINAGTAHPQGTPAFTLEEISRAQSGAFTEFSRLDYLGRCGAALACLGQETLPTQPRGSISHVYPSGWDQRSYEFIDEGVLYNRCHLIAFSLCGENDNERNLITGTRAMNVDGKDVEDLASALVFTNTYTKPAEPSEPKTPGASTKQNLPKTGDASLAAPVAFILAAAVACGAGVVMRRRG